MGTRTHYKYYHEEPLSTSEERVAEFERQLVTGLHNNGFLSSRDDIRWTQEQDKMAQMAGSKVRTPITKLFFECFILFGEKPV